MAYELVLYQRSKALRGQLHQGQSNFFALERYQSSLGYLQEDESIDLQGNKAPQGLERLHHAFVTKLLPIGPQSGWSLNGVYQELRLWEQQLLKESSSGAYYLYGCSCQLSALPTDVLETLEDITKSVEWDSAILEVNQISMPTSTSCDSEHSIMTDVVNQILKSPGTISLWLSKLMHYIKVPYLLFTGKVVQLEEIRANRFARTWQKEDDGCCWMFCKKVNKGIVLESLPDIWIYYFLQPVLGESNCSILHYILCTGSNVKEAPATVASRIAALKQYFNMQKLHLPPPKHQSLKHVTESFSDGTKHIGSSILPLMSKDLNNHQIGARDSGSIRKNQSTHKLVLAKEQIDPTQGLWADDSSSDDTGFQSDGVLTPVRKRSRAHHGLGTDLGHMQMTALLEDDYTDVRTLANQCAGEVLEEALKAGVINVNTSEADQKLQTGGWSFQCLQKDVVILKKHERGSRYYSFIGKGLIRSSPENVFKAVKNPRTRFIYDNMLKRMDILSDLVNDLVIYNMVHEVPQIIRKESRNFCILQTSRTDGQRHIVAARSVDWPNSPPVEDGVVRAKIRPSGWLIEPAVKKNAINSIVTYIVQIDVGGKDVPQSFVQFLSRRIPLSVAYLRLFLEADLP